MTTTVRPRLWRFLALPFFACLTAIGPAAAQQTFTYQSPAFSVSDCMAHVGSVACVAGSVTASVTLDIAPGYTGWADASAGQVLGYSLSASGTGVSFRTGDCLDAGSRFYLDNGVIKFWDFQVSDAATCREKRITISSYSVDESYDYSGAGPYKYGLQRLELGRWNGA